ncbi:MAG: tol-pal system YbgF family protein, partial [Acidiferrobacterales bacterium]
MNKTILIGLVLPLLLWLPLANAQSPASGSEVQKVEASGLPRLLSQLWAKVRAYVPRSDPASAQARRTHIAGVRGAESTDSALQPYWKGDKSEDPAYLEQLKAFDAAAQLADAGKHQQAAIALNKFLQSYPDSDLNASAQFALAVVYGEIGDKPKAVAALSTFTQT